MAVNDITKDFPENPGPVKEPVLPAEPIQEPGPMIPEEPTPEPAASKAEEPVKLAELANNLYDSATKMQRDAEALMEAIKKDSESDSLLGEEKTPAPMTPEETDAASNALIGL